LINVMNVVTVPAESAPGFEDAFANRERLLGQAEGFEGFELLRRPVEDEQVEYLVISRWRDEDAFHGWVRSDLFKKAHARDGQRSFGGHSEIRRYDVIDVEEAVA
jgi:heme oxygenase (staphylobilin-producing)